MDYQQFVTVTNEKINGLLSQGTISQQHTTLKNNGIKRTGLTFSQMGVNISPTIYLEEYYHHFQNGMELDEIVERILSLYQEVKYEHNWDIDQIQSFPAVADKLAFKLIHFEKNNELLKKIPYIKYFDLAIVFFLLVETTEKGAATILITQDILNYWQITLEELHDYALRNTPRILQPDFKPMKQVIYEMMNLEYDDDMQPEDNHMYVLSNQYRHFGAGCILYDRVLEDIGNQLHEDFYILPSSIHEVIILPVSCDLTSGSLDEMIIDINETQVSEEDVLSDHAYYYCREDGILNPSK